MSETIGDKARLEHILESVRLIQKFTEGATFEDFYHNEMMFAACIRHLAIIGEAATNLTIELRANYPEVTWRQMIGMRNIVIHKYFGTSEHLLWLTIHQDLPLIKTQIET
ncbi:MAG: DUF86 domain-containing protein, partial [Saprospiraceae bacterium]